MPMLTMPILTNSLAHEFHVLCRLGAHISELGDENVAEGVELSRFAVMHAQLLQNHLVGGGRWGVGGGRWSV